MRSRALIAVGASLWAAAGLAAPAPSVLPVANATLLHSARAWEVRGRGDLARLALEKLIAARPDAPEFLALLGELCLRMGDAACARGVLARLQAEHPRSAPAADFAVAYRIATVDRLPLASVRRLLETGQSAAALAALRRLFPDGAPRGALGVEYYQLLARTPQGWELARQGLARLAAAHPEDPRYRLALARELASHAATARSALGLLGPLNARDDLRRPEVEGGLDAAVRTLGFQAAPLASLRAYTRRNPADARAAQALARRSRAGEAPAESAADSAARRRAFELDEQAQAELRAGDSAAARADFAAALALAPGDPWIRYRLAQRLAADGEVASGRELLEAALVAHPDDVDTRYALALYLASSAAPQTALAVVAEIPPAQRTPGIAAFMAQLQATLAAAARAPPPVPAAVVVAAASPPPAAAAWVIGGLEIKHKPGDPGTSDLSSLQLPLEWHPGAIAGGDLLVRADAVRLDAGRLPRDFAAAAQVGTVAAAGPAALPGLRIREVLVSGVALGLGWRSEQLAVDLGTTPLGFPITNVVGGVKWTPKLGALDLALGLTRRPVTSSVLSYAGLEDPASARTWGGVVETGPAVQVAHYDAGYSVAGSLRVSWLEGRHVLRNQFTGARFAADRRLVERPEFAAYVGVAVTYWAYQHSLLGYTYGSGGYYSPHAYLNLALPVEATGRGLGWSYRVRAAVAHSASHTRDAAYYPLDPALQLMAAQNLAAPVVSGGHSTGASVSLYAAAERSLSARLVFGAVLNLDRSDYYHPTTVLVYLRHAFGPATTPLAAPPRPIRPYADF